MADDGDWTVDESMHRAVANDVSECLAALRPVEQGEPLREVAREPLRPLVLRLDRRELRRLEARLQGRDFHCDGGVRSSSDRPADLLRVALLVLLPPRKSTRAATSSFSRPCSAASISHRRNARRLASTSSCRSGVAMSVIGLIAARANSRSNSGLNSPLGM